MLSSFANGVLLISAGVFLGVINVLVAAMSRLGEGAEWRAAAVGGAAVGLTVAAIVTTHAQPNTGFVISLLLSSTISFSIYEWSKHKKITTALLAAWAVTVLVVMVIGKDLLSSASQSTGQPWLASLAVAVVALVSAWVWWAMPDMQQRPAEAGAAAREMSRQARAAEAERQAAWEQRCRALLVNWPLPKIADADPYQLGVFYSRRADAYRGNRDRPPYVPRAVDQQLAALLRSQPLILVKGQSRSGKSRTAFEVAAQELGNWRLLAPKDRSALAALAELDPQPGKGEPVLVWLDDLDRYLAVEGTSGLNAALLARWAASDPPVKVLATIRLEEYGRLAAAPGELGRTVRELLNRFDPGAITVPSDFDTPAEQAATAQLYADERVAGGLGEHLAAAHELVDRLEIGQASVPEGAAVVLAAVDWRWAGLERPITRADLAALLPLYLERLRPLVPLETGDLERAISWATEPVGRTAALLVSDPLTGTFRVADSIVYYVERREGGFSPDPRVWDYLLTHHASLEDVMDIGFRAYTRNDYAAAKMAFQRVANSGHADLSPRAAVVLGVLVAEQGDLIGAAAAYQQAIDSGHAEQAPIARLSLAALTEPQNAAGALAAYRQAIDSGHPDAAPRAALNLGVLLEEQGDHAGALAAYRQAIDSSHPHAAPRTMLYVAMLLAQLGDLSGAHATLERALAIYEGIPAPQPQSDAQQP
jgi:tetratricopeptide (TPR) repeat protein